MLSKLMGWIDYRFPLTAMYNDHMAKYPAPKNLNFWYFFGSLAMLVLVNQIITGIWLTMNYNPSAEGAFASVEYIMRDVEYGWLLRYMHSTGASAFFIVVYMHMFRGMIYGSYQKPRELLWIFGMLIFLVLMAEAFMGYLLPWGQMSFWGAQVIISLFGAIPVIGDDLTLWIRGDYVISGATLNRFFALHVIALPLVLVMLVAMHILALHEVGSNNPDGIDIKKHKDENGWPLDAVAFHPYFTVKDMIGVAGFLFFFCAIIFFKPDMWATSSRSRTLKWPTGLRPGAYCACVVLHAVLRHFAGGAGQTAWRHHDGSLHCGAVPAAVVGSLQGALGALSQQAAQAEHCPVCGVLRDSGDPRGAAVDADSDADCPNLYLGLFRVLRPAVLL